jgi:DNA-binding NarL/FixJ family response regulator
MGPGLESRRRVELDVAMAREPVRVLVVDDDYYAREATRVLLSRDRRTRIWGLASTLEEGEKLLTDTSVRFAPHVILQDIHLTEGPRAGISAIITWKGLCPDAKVLVMSMDCEEDVVVEAIRAGADGYVWKNESADGIATAVVQTADGRFVVTRSVAERLLGSAVDLQGYATEILPERHPYRELTDAIRETLHLYCVCGMSASEVADELQVSVNTVYSRIKTAYHVLDARTREDAFQRFVDRAKRTGMAGGSA